MSNAPCVFQFIAKDSEVYACIFVQNLILHLEKYFNSEIKITERIVPEFENSALSFLREVIYHGYRVIYDNTNVDGKIQYQN